MKIVHKIHMDLDRCSVPGFDAVRGDRYTRELEIALSAGGEDWLIPGEATVIVRYQRPDGTGGSYDRMPNDSQAWRVSGNTVTVALAPETMTMPGCVILTVTLTAEEREISTFQILMNVHPAAALEAEAAGDRWYLSGNLPQPEDAQAGELLAVTSVDALGRVNGLRTVPMNLTDAQYKSLEDLLKLATYQGDPKDAMMAFREAFGRYVPATGIALDAEGLGIASGEPQRLIVTLMPENCTETVEWTTSDSAVATVQDGLVTPMGNGNCVVTARAGSVSASCTVTVTGMSHIHDYTLVVSQAPTCTEIGGHAYRCSCGDGYIENIPATGHQYVDGFCTVCGGKDPIYFPDGYYAVEWVQQNGYYKNGVLTQEDGAYNTGFIAVGGATKLYCKWEALGTYYITYFDANGKYSSQLTGAWSDMRRTVTLPTKAAYVVVSYYQADVGKMRVMFNAEETRHTVDNPLAAGGGVTNVVHGSAYTVAGMETLTSVTMGGENITGSVYDSTLGTVTIPAVTGNVVIR